MLQGSVILRYVPIQWSSRRPCLIWIRDINKAAGDTWNRLALDRPVCKSGGKYNNQADISTESIRLYIQTYVCVSKIRILYHSRPTVNSCCENEHVLLNFKYYPAVDQRVFIRLWTIFLNSVPSVIINQCKLYILTILLKKISISQP